jgi:sugar-phosphatase
LNAKPIECVAFEDSFFGMIAAKAARMKCIVIPTPSDYHALKWNAADLILENLHSFKIEHLKRMQ